MSDRAQPRNGIHPATVGLIFVAVIFFTILLIGLYYWVFNNMTEQTRLDQRVARRERAFDHDASDKDLEMQEVPSDDLKVPPKR